MAIEALARRLRIVVMGTGPFAVPMFEIGRAHV